MTAVLTAVHAGFISEYGERAGPGVDGDGLFMVNQGAARYYTRAGQFSLDKDGNIVNPDGLVLQGYLADAAGNITGATGDLQIATRQSQANPSTNANITLNLDSTATPPPERSPLGVGTTPGKFQFASTT